MSLVGFRARNHPQQRTRDDVDDRRTPREFFDPLHDIERFTLDAAASHENALLPCYFTRETNGLVRSWAGHRVWCNPPYSNLAAWVEKARAETIDGGCELVGMLLPANRCEQGFWQRHVEPYRDGAPFHGVQLRTRFLPGRMRFGWPADRVVPAKGDRPPFGLVLVTWRRVVVGPRSNGTTIGHEPDVLPQGMTFHAGELGDAYVAGAKSGRDHRPTDEQIARACDAYVKHAHLIRAHPPIQETDNA